MENRGKIVKNPLEAKGIEDNNGGLSTTARGRLRDASRVVDLVSMGQALDVPVEDVRGYLNGSLAYPATAEGERRLVQIEAMCEALGDVYSDEEGDEAGAEGSAPPAAGPEGDGLEREVLRDEALVLEGSRSDWLLPEAGDGDGVGDEEPVSQQGYARFGDAPASRVLGREPEPVPMVVGLDTDGDGKMDIEFPGAVVTPRSGNWNEDIEMRRQQLWTAWSIARMTQHRLMKRRETMAALGWVESLMGATGEVKTGSGPPRKCSLAALRGP